MYQDEVLKRIYKEKKKKTGHLDLQLFELTNIPKEILDLKHLRSLNLRGNKITDISILDNLPNLTALDLSENQISEISVLEKFTNLRYLELTSNLIHNILPLQSLTQIELIELTDNKINDISPLLDLIKEIKINVHLEPGLQRKGIILGNNPLSSPPVETIARGTIATIKFLEDLKEQGTARLYEAKLILVGDGAAGKTSLARKLDALENPLPGGGEDRTKGIDIQAMPIANIREANIPFLMNVWDFGGQGYYHSTHQFFLTKRSLYVLLNNTRINKTDFNDWLQRISLFSDNSPVILVENEVGGSQSELDLRGLRQHFDNILYVRKSDIKNTTDGRLRKLIDDIKIEIQRLPHVGSELPKQWVQIREVLTKVSKTEAHISDRQFYEICRSHKILEREAMQRLGDLFHDLGIFLHFRDDKVLKRLVILQNTWATKGVYTILDNEAVRAQKGYFTIRQAEDIWRRTPYEEWYEEMVSLMEKFKLCYRIPYSSPSAYISPNLLPKEKPAYRWNYDQNLVIHYDYEFMPKGLLGMLIVELHRHVKDIKNLAWRNGCLFHYQKTDAQVIETYGKRSLEIRIKGLHPVRLSSIIISELDRLNDSFERIKVKKLIPCSCTECQESDSPQFYEYDDLLRRKEKNKETIECSVSYKDIDVLEILEASYNENFAKEPSIQELVAKVRIREAIDIFEKQYPNEGVMLLTRFNHIERFRFLGTIDIEEWSTHMEPIVNALLSFSDASSSGNRSGHVNLQGLRKLDEKLDAITALLSDHDRALNEIIDSSKVQQHDLIKLLQVIEEREKDFPEEFIAEIISVIERGMADYIRQVPDDKITIADWEKASQQLKLSPDSKVKLKFALSFLFITLEKEIAWNGKDYFRAIKKDIQRGIKGNWSEMFITEDSTQIPDVPQPQINAIKRFYNYIKGVIGS